MNRAEKELYLQGYQRLLEEAQEKREIYISYREATRSAKTQRYDDMPVGRGKKRDASDTMAIEEKMKSEYEKATEKAMRKAGEIMAAIDMLEKENEREVLRLRYLELLTWDDIMEIIGKKRTQLHEIRVRAINNIRLKSEH